MALDFPSNPIDGQVYGNFYYSSSKGAWRSTTSFNTPKQLVNAVITNNVATAVPLTVQGYASQSANLQNWTDSTGNTLSSISSAGVPTFPGTNFTSPPVVKYEGITQVVLGGSDANGAIELGRTDGIASTPYIDFHAGATSADYDARIIAQTGTGSVGAGTLAIQAGQLTLPTKTYAPGAIVQVAYGESTTATAVATTSLVQIGGSALTATITPKFSNSKILVVANVGYYSPSQVSAKLSIYRGATMIAEDGYYVYQGAEFNYGMMMAYDSPTTTSATTYSLYARNAIATTSWTVNYSDSGGTVRSTIAVYEVAQ